MGKMDIIREHFDGTNPSLLRLNIKNEGRRVQILIDFGRLVLPHSPDLEKLLQNLGSTKKGAGTIEFTPQAVREIIERDGLLCSASEEHRSVLSEWFDTNFPKILATLKKNK